MQVGVFDLEGVMRRLGGDEELFRDIVQFFFEDSPGLLERLRCGGRDHEPSVIERAAHSLKGMAANFGAQRAVEAALHVETLGAKGDLAEVSEAILALEEEIDILRVALNPYLCPEGDAPD